MMPALCSLAVDDQMLQSQMMCHMAVVLPLWPGCGRSNAPICHVAACTFCGGTYTEALQLNFLPRSFSGEYRSVGLVFQAFRWPASMGTQQFDRPTRSHVGGLRGSRGFLEWGWSRLIPPHHYHNHLQCLAQPHRCMSGQHRNWV